jgi:hypothetical protein
VINDKLLELTELRKELSRIDKITVRQYGENPPSSDVLEDCIKKRLHLYDIEKNIVKDIIRKKNISLKKNKIKNKIFKIYT